MILFSPHGKTQIQGVAFGTMDGVIDILGVMAGIGVATDNKLAVVVGILAASFANAIASSSGFYAAEEVAGVKEKEIKGGTFYAFASCLASGILLTLPIAFLALTQAIIFSGLMGLLVLFLVGYFYGKYPGKSLKIGFKYLIIGLLASAVGLTVGYVARLIG